MLQADDGRLAEFEHGRARRRDPPRRAAATFHQSGGKQEHCVPAKAWTTRRVRRRSGRPRNRSPWWLRRNHPAVVPQPSTALPGPRRRAVADTVLAGCAAILMPAIFTFSEVPGDLIKISFRILDTPTLHKARRFPIFGILDNPGARQPNLDHVYESSTCACWPSSGAAFASRRAATGNEAQFWHLHEAARTARRLSRGAALR